MESEQPWSLHERANRTDSLGAIHGYLLMIFEGAEATPEPNPYPHSTSWLEFVSMRVTMRVTMRALPKDQHATFVSA